MDLNFGALLPEAILVVAGLILLLLEAFLSPAARRSVLPGVALLGVLAAIWAATNPFGWSPLYGVGESISILGGMVNIDGMGVYFRVVLLTVEALIILASMEYVAKKGMPMGEFYALLTFATVGGMFMALAGDIVTFYVGLELLSISSYVMAGMLRNEAGSSEASMKYFLNGATASAVLLFGLSLMFGLSGTTNLGQMAAALTEVQGPLLWTALFLVIAGLGFKIATVPFHLWAPDVYQGSPTPVTLFLAIASKGASFAAILRIFYLSFGGFTGSWSTVLAVLAVITMTIGNLGALWQTNFKRLLAYSSIAHAGYTLAGIATATTLGMQSAMFYVLAYVFMNVAAFGIIMVIANSGDSEDVDSLAGLARRSPILGFLLLISMLSLIGIPATAGFFGKFYIFQAAVQGGFTWVAIAIALNSALSVAYYYRVVRVAYLEEPAAERSLQPGIGLQLGLGLAVLGVLGLGLFPDTIFRWVQLAALVQ